jgi:hypothetical protein
MAFVNLSQGKNTMANNPKHPEEIKHEPAKHEPTKHDSGKPHSDPKHVPEKPVPSTAPGKSGNVPRD